MIDIGYHPAYQKLTKEYYDAGDEILMLKVLFNYREITIIEITDQEYKDYIYSLNAITGDYKSLR